MNEGKPTKAKWWSRPRPQGPSGEPEETAGAAEAGQGVDEARVPAGQIAGPSATDDGDFELARPAARRIDDEGDYELRRPEPAPTAGETVGAAGAPAGQAHDLVPVARQAVDEGTVVSAVPSVGGAGAQGALGSASGDAGAGDGVTVAAGAPVESGPKPLHDPDPYSTPPYGEPGPWAPAPPVQHPAATPAHGVAAPAPQATPAGPVPPPAAPAPAVLVPSPGASIPAPAPAADPWQRYDPWAAPAVPGAVGPLQQNGAGVLSTEQRRRRGRTTLVVGAVLIALVSGGVGGLMGTYLERNGGVGTVELPQAGKEPAARDADSVAGIAGHALPSVVTLHVSGSGEQGTGTGFVLDTRGHILTNNHVVQSAGSGGEITVTFDGGETAQAELVGRDSGYDLAVVKVKGVRGLTPLPLGNSDNVQVGDPVVAIGAPFDLAGTVTSGIISAKQRPITAGGEKGDGSDVSYVDALQTDAPINPGNSGGPLLDARARVIGINSAIRSADSGSDPDGGSQAGSIGLGFAIPINQGKRVAEELINTGKATHPVIGITLDMDYTGDGARVAAEGGEGGPPVTVAGPGAKAGIKSGDVITEVDGQRVHSGEELIVKTRAHRPGDRLELTLERGGKERTVTLVLGSSGG
ncbi:trypsin-like peptidase domain-containing protein [Streptomyces venetus]|uniref:Trypsin-like peptidase domain-containing protein n=1 Tax=Streptomyces venetus TaxID=1701086 RepID=A0ABP8FAE9_9ACTN